MKNLAIYLRISDEDNNIGESESLQNQRDLLHNFISQKQEFANCNIVEFCDDGVSGTTFQRKGIQELINRAGKDIDCIAVKDFSRFGRNLVEVGNYLDSVFPFLGVRFISVNDGYDSADMHNKGKTIGLDISLKAMINDMYSKDLSQKISASKKMQMQKGEYVGKTSVFGYKKAEDNKKKLVIDEMAAQIVRRIFNMIIEGKKTGEIAIILNEEKVPTPYVYRKKHLPTDTVYCHKTGTTILWTTYQIRKIINDERYTGTYIAGKEKWDMTSKKRIVHPKEDWVRIENVQEPIVSREIFDKAASLMRRNNRTAYDKSKYNHALFASILTCQECNRFLKRVSTKNAHYSCTTRTFDPHTACKDVKLLEKDLETAILSAISTQIQLLEEQKTSRSIETSRDSIEKSVKECEQSIGRLNNEQLILFERFADGKVDLADYRHKKAEKDKLIADSRERLLSLQAELRFFTQQNESADNLSKYMFAKKLTREMLLDFVKEVKVFADNRIEIVWNFRE